MQKFLHQGLYWSKVVVLGVVLGVGIQFAEAWTNPTVSAPGGNVAGPLNTGVINQVKNASLGLVGNLSAWMLQPNAVVVAGSACPAGAVNGLLAKDAAGIILSCQSGVWKSALGPTTWVPLTQNLLDRYDGRVITVKYKPANPKLSTVSLGTFTITSGGLVQNLSSSYPGMPVVQSRRSLSAEAGPLSVGVTAHVEYHAGCGTQALLPQYTDIKGGLGTDALESGTSTIILYEYVPYQEECMG